MERLDADRLDKDNGRRTAEGKEPLTIMQIAHRAAHSAAEIIRYDRRKHDALPLESWTDADGVDMESSIINRLTVEDFMTQRDSRDQAIAALVTAGHTERQTGESIGISGVAIIITICVGLTVNVVLIVERAGKKSHYPIVATPEEIDSILQTFFFDESGHTRRDNGLEPYSLGLWQGHYINWKRITREADGLDNLLYQLSPASVERLLQHIEHSHQTK